MIWCFEEINKWKHINKQCVYYMYISNIKASAFIESCPIHPTRFDSSLVFAIRQTRNWFVNSIPSNRHKLFPLLSIRHNGSRFVRDFKNIIWTLRVGWKCCWFESIRSNWHESYELTEVCGHVLRTRKFHVSLFHGSWLAVGYAGWVENFVDSIELTRIVSPVADSSCRN